MADENQGLLLGEDAGHFSRPQGIWGWAEDFFKWGVRNLFFGGFLILVGVGLASFAAIPELEKSGYYTYATILSVVVLSISALFVNTDFDAMSMQFKSNAIYYINLAAKFILLIGFTFVVVLTPSTFVNIDLVDKEWLGMANIAIFVIAGGLAYAGHCIQLHAREMAYRESAKGFSDRIDDVSEIEEEASRNTEVDGLRL